MADDFPTRAGRGGFQMPPLMPANTVFLEHSFSAHSKCAHQIVCVKSDVHSELQAIDDAYRILQRLEGDEEQHAAEKKSRAIEEVLRKLRSIAPKIEKLE